jgi:hypothetical protein
MAASMLARLMGKAVSKTGKKESSEVAKKGTELMGRRDEKFMGMAEEVAPKRLSGPAAKEAEKKSGKVGAAIAAGVGATAATAAALSSREDKKEVSPSRVSTGRVIDARTSDDSESRSTPEPSKAKESAKPSTFAAAFKEARAAGKNVFTYEGKKYTTELAGEKKASEKSTGVREGRNENIDDETRSRARAFVEAKTGPRALASEDDATKRLAKGGMIANKGIGASMKPHNVFGSKGKK